jgi:nicotinamidase-related amidase
MQQDFILPGAPAYIPGTLECIDKIVMLLRAFRKAGRPVIHIIRLYLPDGSNVDACRREMIEQGARIAAPCTSGAELVDELKPDRNLHLNAELLLDGKFQLLASNEWAMYKPRFDAFYETGLENFLRKSGIDTLVFCGCNFPNCPRSSVYGASMRDFRTVFVTDAVSGVYDKGIDELRDIGVVLMNVLECITWLGE